MTTVLVALLVVVVAMLIINSRAMAKIFGAGRRRWGSSAAWLRKRIRWPCSIRRSKTA